MTTAHSVAAPMRRHLRPAELFLLGWSAFWFAVMVWRGGTSWHFFVEGQRALADLDDRLAGGLHLYAALPHLQIGPLTFLAALLAAPAGPTAALLLIQVFGAACGVVILLTLRSTARLVRPELGTVELERRLVAVALFFFPVWMYLAVAVTHLDDVLALLFAVLALRAGVRDRPVLAGLLVGLAVDSKPWALPFAVLLLLIPDLRRRAAGAAALAGVVLVAWLPFFLADPGTVRALHFTIPNTAWSALRVLEIENARTPGWVRPAQTLLGLGLGALAIRRRRWAAMILVVVASRLVIDPGTNRYYIAGLVTGAAVWDLLGSRGRLPWWTATACLGLFSSRWLGLPPPSNGIALLLFFVACVVLAARPPWPVPLPARRRTAAGPRASAAPRRVPRRRPRSAAQ